MRNRQRSAWALRFKVAGAVLLGLAALSGTVLVAIGGSAGITFEELQKWPWNAPTKAVLFQAGLAGLILGGIPGAIALVYVPIARGKLHDAAELGVDLLEMSGGYLDFTLRALVEKMPADVFGPGTPAGKWGSHERITIYVHARAQGERPECFLFGHRYASNPAHKDARRTEYAAGEGIIWQAWQHGYQFEDNLPNPVGAAGVTSWASQQRLRWNIQSRTARAMRLKARTIAAIDVVEQDSGTKVAVIVLESENDHAFTQVPLKAFLDGEAQTLSQTVRIAAQCLKHKATTPVEEWLK